MWVSSAGGGACATPPVQHLELQATAQAGKVSRWTRGVGRVWTRVDGEKAFWCRGGWNGVDPDWEGELYLLYPNHFPGQKPYMGLLGLYQLIQIAPYSLLGHYLGKGKIPVTLRRPNPRCCDNSKIHGTSYALYCIVLYMHVLYCICIISKLCIALYTS